MSTNILFLLHKPSKVHHHCKCALREMVKAGALQTTSAHMDHDISPNRAPMRQVVVHEIVPQHDGHPFSPQNSGLLILEEHDGVPPLASLRIPLPPEILPEMHIAIYHCVKHSKRPPRGVAVVAANFGIHVRRVVIESGTSSELSARLISLSDETLETTSVDVPVASALLFAITNGLPIFVRADLLSRQSDPVVSTPTLVSGSDSSAVETARLSGKQLLREAILSGQLPEEHESEELLVAIANLRRHEIIDLIELAEKYEYYEWAYYLYAFVDLDEVSPGGMDV